MRFQGTVDGWFETREAWRAELHALRDVLRGRGLGETLKWGQPCYTEGDENVLILGALKDCATVSFVKGALLADPGGHLVQPGENSRSTRYVRFRSLAEVEAKRAALEALVDAAVAVARAGLKVARLEGEPELPAELRGALEADAALGAAFAGLTPGRRRAYVLLVGGAKTPAGRASRVAGFTERILAGKGPNDCVCGHTKRPPGCDGSHKHLA